MNYKMASIKDHKIVTALVVIIALASVLMVSTSAIGIGRVVLAANDDNTKASDNNYGSSCTSSGSCSSSDSDSSGGTGVGTGTTGTGTTGTDAVSTVDNTGINVPTYTDQKSNCETVGETSPITTSCNAASTNHITQSGGILTHEHR